MSKYVYTKCIYLSNMELLCLFNIVYVYFYYKNFENIQQLKF